MTYTDNQVSADWEVRKVSDDSLVYSSYGDTSNLTSIAVPPGNLELNTQYKWRVRYTGAKYGNSEWSVYRNFTTGESFDAEILSLHKKLGGNSYLYDVAIDSSGNIFAVGFTSSEGQGIYDALIVKYDSNLNKLAAKIYGGTNNDYFRGVTIDSSGNIFAVGSTTSEGQGSSDALIVKYDSNLNKLAAKIYGGTSNDYFQGVTTDSSGNIFAVGYTASEGQGSNDALIVKYDSNLNKLAAKTYGEGGADYFRGVTIDSSGNIFAVGYTGSEGQGSNDALIVKYDSNLNKLAAKTYGGTSSDYFYGAAISNTTLLAVGNGNFGSGYNSAFIVKTNLATNGTFPTLSYITVADSSLTAANSTLTDSTSNITAANSNLTVGTSSLTAANSNLTSTTDSLA